uniref:DUF2069 domain-containing protein n=1 Tax=Roseateles sp. TaxID=1971397 RepID=UPI00286C3DAB
PALLGLLSQQAARRLYTFRWLSLMIWLYFAEGAVRAASESGLGMWLAIVEVFLSVLIFIACALQVRLRLAAAKAHTAGSDV